MTKNRICINPSYSGGVVDLKQSALGIIIEPRSMRRPEGARECIRS